MTCLATSARRCQQPDTFARHRIASPSVIVQSEQLRAREGREGSNQELDEVYDKSGDQTNPEDCQKEISHVVARWFGLAI